MLLEVWMKSSLLVAPYRGVLPFLIQLFSLVKIRTRITNPFQRKQISCKAVCMWSFFSVLSMHSAPQGHGRNIISVTHCRVYSLFNLGICFFGIEVVSSPQWKNFFLLAFRLFLYPILAQVRRSRKAVLWSWNLLPWAKGNYSVQSALWWKEAWQVGAWHRLATSSQRAG